MATTIDPSENEVCDPSENEVCDPSENEVCDPSENKITTWCKEHHNILHMVIKKTGLTELQAYNGLIAHKGDYKKVIRIGNAYRDAYIVMKQTTYTEKEAFNKLNENNWDIEDVIRKYMGNTTESTGQSKKTVNQQIFTEIRGFMDNAMEGYNERKTHAEHLKQVQMLCTKPKN